MVSASANISYKAKGVCCNPNAITKSDKLMLHGEKIPGPIEMIQMFSKPVVIWKKKNKSEKWNQMVFTIFLSFVTR